MAAAAKVSSMASTLASKIASTLGSYNTGIRFLGDTILQKPAIPFPTEPVADELEQLGNQVKTLMASIIETGGAGIAANQCSDIKAPFQLTIVGIFKECKAHIERVEARYPKAREVFPEAIVMVNPSILDITTTEDKDESICFTHGCLSVKGGIRAEINTPQSITVRYKEVIIEYDAEADSFKFSLSEQKERTFTDTHAVVLKHEIDHIIEGKTYIDRCFEQYSPDTLKQIKTLIESERTSRESSAAAGASSRTTETKSAAEVEKIVISLVDKATGSYTFDPEQFKRALENLENDVLLGLNTQAQRVKPSYKAQTLCRRHKTEGQLKHTERSACAE